MLKTLPNQAPFYVHNSTCPRLSSTKVFQPESLNRMKSELPVPHASDRGFSLVEVLLVTTVVMILSAFALLGVTRARSAAEFSNAARTLQAYGERAVMDAKRRHALGTERAIVEVVNTTSYKITADFTEDGNLESRTINLPSSITFQFTAGSPPRATIDRHGNVAEGNVTFTFRSASGSLSEVKFTSNGDASIDQSSPTLPSVAGTPTSTDVKSFTILSGTGSPQLDPSPTPAPTPLPYCTSSQNPTVELCRCQTGQRINRGKCT